MHTTINKHDLAARFAGDEFVIVLNDIHSKEDLNGILSRLKQTLLEPLSSLDIVVDNLGGAIGVANYPEDGRTVDQLLVAADNNMYANKAKIKQHHKTL